MSDTPPAPPTETLRPAEQAAQALTEQYPDAVTRDDREGYEGIIVEADQLVEIATVLRDRLGFNYLANACAVDYIEDGYFEMVYHVDNVDVGGGALSIKARTPRDEAVLPSLVGVWPGADF